MALQVLFFFRSTESIVHPFFFCLTALWRQHLTALWLLKWMDEAFQAWQVDPLQWPGDLDRLVLVFRLVMLLPLVEVILAVVLAASSILTLLGSCTPHLLDVQLFLALGIYPRWTWVKRELLIWTFPLISMLEDTWVMETFWGRAYDLMTSIVGKVYFSMFYTRQIGYLDFK